MHQPSVLAVTSEPPWPLNSGGHIRTFHLLKALAAKMNVRLLCPAQPDAPGRLDRIREAGIDLRPILVGPRTRSAEAARLAGALVRREPYVLFRRHRWPLLAAAWRRELSTRRPDVLYFDHLDSFLYSAEGPRLSRPVPAVTDFHNVYSLLVRRMADEEPYGLKRAFLRREARLLERVERRAALACAAVFAVSDREADHFRAIGAPDVRTVPNGVDCQALEDLPTGRIDQSAILFLGTMSWGPNAAAARFLALDVIPRVRQELPGVTLLIVGRDPPRDVAALHGSPGIEVAGSVPDVKPYLARAAVLAVPIDAGGGTRLKILEAFAAGLPVVSTAIGVEGIRATPGVHFLQAERATFAEALIGLLRDRGRGQRFAGMARDLAKTTYDWQQIGASAAHALLEIAHR